MPLATMIRTRFRFASDITRAAEVAGILAKYGFAALLADVEWGPIRRAIKSHRGVTLGGQPFEARVRLALTDLGTTFIKLGQMLSTRPDLVGEALATELTKLQDRGTPDPPEVATGVVESELGHPIAECFASFDGVSLASASIGQVHGARLRSGRHVAVKVQHPGIERDVRRDLDVLGFLADLGEKNEHVRRYQPVALVREFSRTTLRELDFRRELRNLQRFRRNFSGDPTVTFPRPHAELSSGRVLTMDFMEGVPVSDAQRLRATEVDLPEIARRGANVYIQMIFRDGFYHADPHPGNILVLADGKIGLLDAGMVGRIDGVFREQIEDVLLAAGDRDAQRLTDAVIRMCGRPEGLDRAALSADLSEFFQEFGTQEVGQFNVGAALTDVSNILTQYGLFLPGKLTMLIKCLVMLESTGRLLNPTFSLAELLAPWRARYVRRRFSPVARLKSLAHLYRDWERLAEGLPRTLSAIMDNLERGKLVMHVEHRHLKSAANRLVVGLFVSSLLLGSAVLIGTKMPPLAWGVSVVGALGYVVAVVFGFRMLWVNRDRHVSGRDGDWD